jgi:tetratricopeptide (TPR) repeat protein
MKKEFILSAILIFGCNLVLYSQLGMGTGRIQGTVLDEEGKALQGATIKVQNVRYKNVLTTTSDKKGRWSLVGLASGPYTVAVALEGYEERKEEIMFNQVTKSAFIWDVKLRRKGEAVTVVNPAKGENEALAALLKEGNRLYGEKQYADAVARFQEFLEKNPNVYQVHINIGNCFREMKDYDKAIIAYNVYLEKVVADKGSLKADNLAAALLSSMGEISLAQGNIDKAKESFKLAVDNFPTDEVLAYNVGEIFFKQGQTDQAIDYLNTAIKIKENWAPPYLRLGYAHLNKGQYALALENLKKFLVLAPDDPQASTIKNLIPDLEKLIKKNSG